jgi:hypothetical protein
MKNAITNPRSAAILGLVLCLPMTTLFSLILLNVEPHFGPLEPLLRPPSDQPAVLATLIVLSAFLLMLAALFITVAPIRQSLQMGSSFFAHPANLILALVILALIAWIGGSVIADQYPCRIAVPNCD